MYGKKKKSALKIRASRTSSLSNLCQESRTGPQCVVCKKSFQDCDSFDEHLKSREHKKVDSPLEYIAERVAEPESEDRPQAFENLRTLTAPGPSGSGQLGTNQEPVSLSSVPIGIDFISTVQVPFCEVCKKIVPDDGQPDVLSRHNLTPEHARLMPIGIDFISTVQVPFCKVCKKIVPDDGQPDVLSRHNLTPEHARLLNG